MARFLKIGNKRFENARNGEYVDKSELISHINRVISTELSMSCVTRCRRFGKSLAASMLRAYYDKSCDSRALFRGLAIEKDPSFEKHLNQYPVIYVEMTNLISKYGHDIDIVKKIQEDLISDLLEEYPHVKMQPSDDVMDLLGRISKETGELFFMIIDEWDAICREFKDEERVINRYVDLLRRLFKDATTEEVFVGAYITGILPIKKYNTQSALNNFKEYTMIQTGRLAKYFGFTKDEVRALCEKHEMSFEDMENWYDGYQIGSEPSMFNPNSVICALNNGECANYWNATGAFDNITFYIQKNFDGLKDAIIDMLAGGRCKVNYTRFSNDLQKIESRDDVLTVLIHLGYLSYDPSEGKCYIPNREVREEMENAISQSNWKEVVQALDASEAMLKAVLNGDGDFVARGIEKIHQRETSILSYNDEKSLSCVATLAFYTARKDYIVHREFASGKGFADIALIPRRNTGIPAIIIELKYNKDVDTALDQIRRKDYPDLVREYSDRIILVGINYDPKTKTHTCRIENV